ncbi:MAG: hypothetical protein AAGK04_00480 [Planctomycetota bacterium]
MNTTLTLASVIATLGLMAAPSLASPRHYAPPPSDCHVYGKVHHSPVIHRSHGVHRTHGHIAHAGRVTHETHYVTRHTTRSHHGDRYYTRNDYRGDRYHTPKRVSRHNTCDSRKVVRRDVHHNRRHRDHHYVDRAPRVGVSISIGSRHGHYGRHYKPRYRGHSAHIGYRSHAPRYGYHRSHRLRGCR